MTSKDILVTTVPVNIVPTLALGNGLVYSIQNLSTTGTLFVREQSLTPVGQLGHRVESGGRIPIEPSGIAIWLWTDDPSGAIPVICTEAVSG